MMTVEILKAKIEEAVAGATIEVVRNESPSGQHSLRVNPGRVVEVARFLRDAPEIGMDHASNVTGVDWPDRVEKVKRKVKTLVEGVEKEVEETIETKIPGFLEAVYHLYSMVRKDGPVILRMRTEDRGEKVRLPSLTPVWRSCELQEREIFDLYGIVFEGHPDLRRLLMWDEFQDHPMRKDYVDPDDFEYEPTPHGDVLTRAQEHYPGKKAGS